MSEENKNPSVEEIKDGFDLQEIKQMTVGEAVRKDSEFKAGVTENDSILDKYIKQHREEVISQKFESKLSDFESLDTGTMDYSMNQQPEESSVNSDDVVSEEITEIKPTKDKEIIPDGKVEVASVAGNLTFEEKEIGADDSLTLDDKSDNQPVYKNKGLIIGGLAILILGIFAVSYGLNNQSSSGSSSSSTTKKTTSNSSEIQAKKDKKSFDDLYASFFTDGKQISLKNSEFGSLSRLKEILDKLTGTTYYNAAKERYDNLSAQIKAIEAVNALFGADIIVNGAKGSSTVKTDANFDSLSSDVLNTGNATLDTVLQSAVSDGRSQLDALAASTSSSNEANQGTVPATPNVSSGATPSPATSSIIGASGYGISSYDTSILQRNLSRVPYNDSAIADSTNPAWIFTDGILDKIVNISHSRGYFTGNNYILEKVNIINGNGYYNMFKSDGTYLFSINAKTGYFVGNASGHADALDY